MDVSVEIHCAACGSANYALADEADDAAELGCNDCGRPMGRLGDLKAEMLAQAIAGSAGRRRRGLGGGSAR